MSAPKFPYFTSDNVLQDFSNELIAWHGRYLVHEKGLSDLTQMVIEQDESGVWAHYVIPTSIKSLLKANLADQLENFRINMSEKEYGDYTVFKVFHSHKNPNHASIAKNIVEPKHLGTYMDMDPANLSSDTWFMESSQDLVLGEYEMVRSIFGNTDNLDRYFQPIPLVKNGKIPGLKYFIYDKKLMSVQANEELQQIQNKYLKG